LKTNRPYFIAEVSSNHHNNIERCFEFIDVSAAIGCDAVKFQLFKVDKLFSPEVFIKMPEVEKRKKWELPVGFLPELKKRSEQKQIDFGVTPFYLEAVDELLPYVDFYKVASYELLWHDLLKACSQTGKPLIVSTGMATMDEIKSAVDVILQYGCKDLTVLHCTSTYPSPPNECNLAAIKSLKENLQCPIGWSDHSVSPGVIHRSIYKWDAKVVEFHLDLEGKGDEYAQGHCWLPDQMKAVINSVREGIIADGSGFKEPAPSEKSERMWRADPNDGFRPLKEIRNTL
jgi:N-acetylneuraminate synthase